MFYYVRMEDIVPENHLLRLIDRHIDLKFQKQKMGILYDRMMGRNIFVDQLQGSHFILSVTLWYISTYQSAPRENHFFQGKVRQKSLYWH